MTKTELKKYLRSGENLERILDEECEGKFDIHKKSLAIHLGEKTSIASKHWLTWFKKGQLDEFTIRFVCAEFYLDLGRFGIYDEVQSYLYEEEDDEDNESEIDSEYGY